METRHLESRIATLRAQVRRLLALRGFGRAVGLTVPLVLAAGLADWLIHLDSGVRLTALLALAGFAAWLVFRDVVAPWVVRFGDLDIALRIEERWPGLNDRLASTVQFLKLSDDEDRHGSRDLREATIRQTLEETRSLDFREAIERRPTRQALGLAAGSLAVALAVVAAQPGLSRIAARRLFLPFGADRWPQQTHLTLLDGETPRVVARGEPFSLAVSVGKGERAPSSARATYRFEDGEVVSEPLRSFEGGFRGRVESVERSFRFSVAAGDDSTSVRNVAVKVVPPPTARVTAVRLLAPEYTRLEPQTLAAGNTQIKAVEGTRVEVEAVANKAIGRATLRRGEASPPLSASLDGAKTRLRASFTLTESTPFWFDLLDTEGFRSREAVRYDARVVRDEAPRVVIDEPVNDRDVPAGATVPVEFTVDDDFGIQSARLVYKTATGGSEPTREVVLPLWDSGDSPDGKPVKRQQVSYPWDLAPLKLAPGSVVTFHADARDFDTIKGPKLGKSRELRLRILSEEDIARQVDDARRAIREDLEGILAMQNQAITPVDEAMRTLSKAAKLAKPAQDNLRNGELIQRQVGSRITSRADGLEQKINRFLDDQKNFKMPNADAQKQMMEMREGVDRVKKDHLGPAEQGLTRATKSFDDSPDQEVRPPAAEQPDGSPAGKSPQGDKPAPDHQAPGPQNDRSGSATKNDQAPAPEKSGPVEPRKDPQGPAERAEPTPSPRPADARMASLGEAQSNQKAIAEELRKMLAGLSEFETYRGVVKDTEALLKQHEQVMKQTAEVASKPEMIGKPVDKLSPEQKADLANLADRQSKISKGAQNLREKFEQMEKRLADSDPLAASAMKEASELLKNRGTPGKAGEVADQLEKNQMGAAKAGQAQTRQDLKDLVDSIQNRRERELSRLVKELKNAEADLEKLRQRQTQNLERTRAAQKNPDAKSRANELKRLAKEQAEIGKQLESQLKRLTKLSADRAAQSGAKAAGKMAKAGESLEQGEGEKADRNEDEALADLEDAQDRLQETRREAEEQLAMEQLSKMGDRLKGMAERQDKVLKETIDYEALRVQKQGKLTIAQRTSVRNLAGVQEAIKDETAELIDQLEGAPVFALTLKKAASGMETAARRLQLLKTDESTQRAASAAAGRFRQLIDALKPEKAKNAGQQQGGGQGGGGGAGGGGDGIPPAAQLKMLKALQEEINERTDYFDELKRRGKDLSTDQAAELDQLETDQGALADLVRDLARPKTDDAEE